MLKHSQDPRAYLVIYSVLHNGDHIFCTLSVIIKVFLPDTEHMWDGVTNMYRYLSRCWGWGAAVFGKIFKGNS